MADPWALIHAERKATLDDVEGLTEDQWATQSLCTDWTVRDVLAHMTATAKMTPPRLMGKFLASGFNFKAMSAKDVAHERGENSAEALENFRAHIGDTTHPPGPIDGMVAEAVIHGEDIRRPLGITREYPEAATTNIASFITKSNLLLGGKRRSEGLALKATDASWTLGDGPEVSGPLVSIVLALTGRKAGLDGLEGEGVATLAGRI